jgi:hypothetical protein
MGQRGQMKAHRGGGHAQPFGDGARGHAICARLNQQAKGGKPVFLRQRAQRGDDIFRFGQLRGDGGHFAHLHISDKY